MAIINALPRWEKQKLQEKTVTAGTSAITVVPDDKFAISQVTINPTPSEAKAITPSTAAQTVTPPTGKLYNSVTVNAIPAPVLVWSGEVQTGDITVNLSAYKYVVIVTKTRTNVDTKKRSLGLIKVGTAAYVCCNHESGQGTWNISKKVTVTTSKVTVGAAGAGSGYAGENVVIQIWGIKYDLGLDSAIG